MTLLVGADGRPVGDQGAQDSILDPQTGLTADQQALLLSLRCWTVDPQILRAMIEAGLATAQQLVVSAHRVQATLAPTPETKRWALAPPELAIIGWQFVRNRRLRRVIVKQTWKKGRRELPEGTTPASLLAGLTDLSERLQREYGLEARADRGQLEERARRAGLHLL